jgi:type IV secretory pathway VirD2 relaxase
LIIVPIQAKVEERGWKIKADELCLQGNERRESRERVAERVTQREMSDGGGEVDKGLVESISKRDMCKGYGEGVRKGLVE